MIMEPKHKNFKGQLQIKDTVPKRFNIRRHIAIPRAFDYYYFKIILNRWHSPFKGTEYPIFHLKGTVASYRPYIKVHGRYILYMGDGQIHQKNLYWTLEGLV
jgi:hypothetical protein